MREKLGKLLKEARLKKQLTQTQVADKAAISQPYYNLIENDKSIRPPSLYIIEQIARVLGCDRKILSKIVQLMQLEYKRKVVSRLETRLGQNSKDGFRPIPILSDIPADISKDFTGMVDEYYESSINDPNAFFLRAKGDCMAPEIKKGDLLLIVPNEKVESGDIAAVVNGKGEKEVTRITMRKNEIILTPDNPAYPTIVWEAKDEPKIIGRVKEIIRRR